MIAIKERYVVDETGNRISVILDIDDYRKLLEELEELECIRAYDLAKTSNDEVIPFEQLRKKTKKLKSALDPSKDPILKLIGLANVEPFADKIDEELYGKL